MSDNRTRTTPPRDLLARMHCCGQILVLHAVYSASQ